MSGLLSGCATQATDLYAERVDQALEVRNRITDEVDANSLQSADEYNQAAVDLDQVLTELDAEDPPQRFSAPHERLVTALDGMITLLVRRGRCEHLETYAEQDARACRLSIQQEVYDSLRNDFREADALYRRQNLALLNNLRDETDDKSGFIEDELTDSSEG